MSADARTQHTPGPWYVVDGVPNGGGIAIGPSYDDTSDTVGYHALVTFNGGESEGNARLIAEAPALYDVVRNVLGGLLALAAEDPKHTAIATEYADECRAIIARIEER